MNKISVQDICDVMHHLAPQGLALPWDNAGLQLGDRKWPVSKVLLTLDVTPAAVEKAIRIKADCIVSHHPLIFKPLKQFTDPLLLKLAHHKMAVYSAHTNLDAVPGGVNSCLAEKLGLSNCESLSSETGCEWMHVTVYVPQSHLVQVREAVAEAGAGIIGNYDHCATQHNIEGFFRPLEASNPAIGTKHVTEKVHEVELEFFCESFRLPLILQTIRTEHLYETPVYYAFPVKTDIPTYGMGLIGSLSEAVPLRDFAHTVMEKLGAPEVSLWLANARENDLVQKIAICGGSGGSFVSQIRNRADVYVSGDFNYHTKLESPLPLIDAGHFWTEYPVLEMLAGELGKLELDVELFHPEEHEISKNLTIY